MNILKTVQATENEEKHIRHICRGCVDGTLMFKLNLKYFIQIKVLIYIQV